MGGEAPRTTMTLYLDVFFMINFGMDYLLLLLLKQLLRLSVQPGETRAGRSRIRGHLRLLLAALFGALWSCIVVLSGQLPAVQQLLGPGQFRNLSGMPAGSQPVIWPWILLLAEWVMTWVIVGGVMIRLAFGRKSLREFMRCLAGLWAIGALAGGVYGALDGAWTVHGAGIANPYPAGAGVLDRWSFLQLGFGAAGICFGVRACAGLLRAAQMRACMYEVTLRYRGQRKTVTALWDTGNQLYEPYGHQPVHVITYEACRGWCDRVTGVIYIPFCAVGTGYGMLPGIQIDKMEIAREGKLVRSYDNPWIAISREPLSPRHQYEMLLHGEQ